MSFVERTVRVNGMTLHYLDWGAADRPPVILLHGITGHARVWDHLASRLLPGHRVIALDQRGHGDSDPAPDDDYGVATMADDVAAFATALRLPRFALVGHSMGGRIAIRYAGDHAAHLDRLVIIDIGPEIDLAGLRRVRDMMAQSPERISLAEIIEVIDGPRDGASALGGLPESPVVKVIESAWQEVQRAERGILSQKTLAELLRRAQEGEAPVYQI